METQFHATTICAVRKNGKTAIAGDGQVTFGEHTIMKANARKVRTLYHGKVLAGFAGSVADAFTLFEKFEGKLEALLLVADKEKILMLSGNGEVIEPDGDAAAIGSGGFYALAAARAMVQHTEMEAAEVAKEALSIAADICVYTNHNIKVEELA